LHADIGKLASLYEVALVIVSMPAAEQEDAINTPGERICNPGGK